MTRELYFQREVTAQGRNGNLRMSGVEVFNSSMNTMFISPMTSRKKPGNCWIEIPQEDLQSFIDLLKSYL